MALNSGSNAGSTTVGSGPPNPHTPCLCTFDIDRTLTAHQMNKNNPNVVEYCAQKHGLKGLKTYPIQDRAFHRGNLTLSQVGRNLSQSFCRSCYLGIVSAGNAGGYHSDERAKLVEQLQSSHGGKGPGLVSTTWSGPLGPNNSGSVAQDCASAKISSPLVAGCKDGTKQEAVKKLLHWFKSTKNVTIDPKNVWHFDDVRLNIDGFKGTSMNARQISCSSRQDWNISKNVSRQIGFCGAETAELVSPEPGIRYGKCTK